jgi:hypothetical protein
MHQLRQQPHQQKMQPHKMKRSVHAPSEKKKTKSLAHKQKFNVVSLAVAYRPQP